MKKDDALNTLKENICMACAYMRSNDISTCDISYCDNRHAIKVLEEERQKMIDAIDSAINATDSQDNYSVGKRNGMRYVKSLIDGKEQPYELCRSDEEIKLDIDLGDEVVDDYGFSKGVVVGIDTYMGDIWLSLLMRDHKVPQFVNASGYKTKTGRHFTQIADVWKQIRES